MEQEIGDILRSSAALKVTLSSDPQFLQSVTASAKLLSRTINSGGTIYACGNGGSACDAAHLCEELVARYKRERPGIKAMHFGDPGVLTCWANDYDFASVFERQAKTFCTDKDTLVAISTSGNSANVLKAAIAAKAAGSAVIGLTGKDGGKLVPLCDTALVVPHTATERIQECHITVVHIWCELLETVLAS